MLARGIQAAVSAVFGNYVFTMRTGLAKGLKRRVGFGFKPRGGLTKEEQFLAELDLAGKTVFDVGGYVGIYALFFARAVGGTGKVVSFEPNPVNVRELRFNLKLNNFENVCVIERALGKEKCSLELVSDPVQPALSTLDASMKNKLLRRGTVSTRVDVDALDALMSKDKLPVPDFIKMDVEGYELEVLRGMEKTVDNFKPQLFIEIHGELSDELFSFLKSKNYRMYHIESGRNASPGVLGGHVYCHV